MPLADGNQETVQEQLQVSTGQSQSQLSPGLRNRRTDGVQLHAISCNSPPSAQVRWRVDGPMRLPGSLDPTAGKLLQRKQHSIQGAQLTVRYYPLGLAEPEFCIPDLKGKVETYTPL